MGFEIIRCPYCGNEGKLEKREDSWFCAHCGNSCTDDGAERAYERIRANIGAQMAGVIDDALMKQREEQYYNLRSLLWEKAHAKYTDSSAIITICRDIKKLEPHDFLATFFEVANSGTPEDVSSFIHNISIRDNGMFADTIIDFTLKSLTSELIMPLSYFIERAYKGADMQKFEEYVTKLEAEAQKVDSGIYSTMAPRDVFIAYSSKDMEKVIELMNLLESNGLSCFVALRNLQHGRGAVANYRSALRQAIDNCKMLVFVSSKNSRNFSCDALKEELGYIRENELRTAPPQFKNDYVNLPNKYKKMRVEYRLDDTPSPVDRFVREFFSGLDYCESADKVLARIADYIFYGNDADAEKEPEPTYTPIPVQTSAPNTEVNAPVSYCTSCGATNKRGAKFCASCGHDKVVDKPEKYCLSCGTKNELNAKFCDSCGSKEFAYTVAEREKILAERRAAEEAKRRALAEAERKAKEEAERKAKEEEARKELERAEQARQAKLNAELEDMEARKKSLDFVNSCCTVIDGKITKCHTQLTTPLAKFIIPEHVTAIADRAFEGCKSFNHLVIPSTLKSHGEWAFKDCSMKRLTILPGCSMINTFAFYGCRSLKTVELPETLTKISSYAFEHCEFTEIKLPDSLVTIGNYVFQYSSITKLNIPKNLSTIGDGLCDSCHGLTEVTVDPANKSFTEIDGNLYNRLATEFIMLGRRASKYSLNIPGSVKTIRSNACCGTKNLAAVTIPSSVTKIGGMAFYRCEALRELFIPTSVTSVGHGILKATPAAIRCGAKKKLLGPPDGWDREWRDNTSTVTWNCIK